MHRSGKRTRLLSIMTASIFHFLLYSAQVMAAHPLITDDAGTQGRGKFLLELNSEIGKDREIQEEVSVKSRDAEVEALLSIGVAETVDVVLGLPYFWSKVKENDELTSDQKGLSDFSMEVKWRFWETEGFSVAVKPGVSFPSGNEEKGLGTGRVAGSLYFITTASTGPWACHFNAGYLRNENKIDERENLWHFSLAAEVEAVKGLRLVSNIGVERNPERDSSSHPAFVLGGIIYSLLNNLDVDLGVRAGLNSVETDFALLAGMAFRF